LGPTTTVILLARPECYALKKVFLEFLTEVGSTVIDLKEEETYDADYELSKRSFEILKTLLSENTYEKILTHPRYRNDSQNNAIYDTVEFINRTININHYVYKFGVLNNPCGVKKGIIELYCKVVDNKLNKKMYDNFIAITSKVDGIVSVNGIGNQYKFK
jgi:hypothetical protein